MLKVIRQACANERTYHVEALVMFPAPVDELRGRISWCRRQWIHLIRLGEPTPDVMADIAARLEPLYPSKSDALNRELCIVLTAVQSAHVAEK